MNFAVLLQGMGMGASLLMPIGAQNAYLLNQGIKKQHHLTIAAVYSFLDIIFISAGIFGGGQLIASRPVLLNIITTGGIIFLLFYAFLSLKSAFTDNNGDEAVNHNQTDSRATAIGGALAITLLNPHLYLDTIVILGSIGGQFNGNERLSFAVGSIAMSFLWFYSLSMAAAKLSPVLSRPGVRRLLDIAVAVLMLLLAIKLAHYFFR
ncbi:LysE/ArgO family amino acid transporter [Vibrio salinus]|uniref:LysE/ArgO family amino acid transporter n=1 Tax=Vibrio salinus TaxID=2899784 RepID=UPI001E4DFCA7|nr:LysE/ArgO family amino acid transporter [Vibrio salinus]MCE0494148.1 LysE/ArgO family amino acid transporter [Vibrio salinus]